jgi:transketolase
MDARPAVSDRQLANAVRALAMDAVEAAQSGHPGLPMGMADVATVLFTRFLKFNAAIPDWPDRDRFVLSAGHGSMLLYALLHLTGYADLSIEQLKKFRQLGSKTPGHPEAGHCAGVETTTGPLGQGIATAVGMALAERILNARYGGDLVDHFTYVLAGDGCLMEGISHEAIDLAGHLRLNKLIVLFDDNSISIDGPTSLATSMDQLSRFQAAGWRTVRVHGHDTEAVSLAIAQARACDRPSLIACKTIIGYGAPHKQGTETAHGTPLGAGEIAAARTALDWPHAPFLIPDPVLAAWRAAGARGEGLHRAWLARLTSLDPAQQASFHDALRGRVSETAHDAIDGLKRTWAGERPQKNIATRQASRLVLEAIAPAERSLVGGSADLTHSNLTHAKVQLPVAPGQFAGRYIHYGVREHAMGAAMNGMALHGGIVPYGGTFLAFADYCRPSIRLSALMGLRVIYVMTHDSIGLGEDGPTHQPIEHLASLRAMPNVLVFRPADAIETAEAWACALSEQRRPSILCLSRQNLRMTRHTHADKNLVARGAYIVQAPAGGRDVTLLSTGSEVSIAMDAAQRLEAEGIRAAVVSMPCWELFEQQPRVYQDQVLGHAPRIAIEAAVRLGWDQWIGREGAFIGMKGFGASGPAAELYSHFNITADAVIAAARRYAR